MLVAVEKVTVVAELWLDAYKLFAVVGVPLYKMLGRKWSLLLPAENGG